MTARARVKKRVRQLATETYREAILEAAERAFLGAGYHQAKMSDVAREAGVSIGTLYNYFDSKEQVFSSLVEAGRAEFLAALDVVDPSVSPLERAFAIVRSAMDHIEERGELFAIDVAEHLDLVRAPMRRDAVEAAAWYILARRAGLVDHELDVFMEGLTDETKKKALERANRLR